MVKNEIGNIYGLLTVIERDKSKPTGKGAFWICKCECGNTKSIRGDCLRNGHTQSCGCLKEKEDLTGKTFGKLTVLYKTDKRDSGRHIYWHCKCECGTELDIVSISLKSNSTKSCGCLKSIGEEKISKILTENNILFEKEKTFSNCRFEDTNTLARFDFYLPDYNILIEYDGIQHFKAIGGWNNELHLQQQQIRDNYKNNWCKNNNIKLIRIPYTKIDTLSIFDIIKNL